MSISQTFVDFHAALIHLDGLIRLALIGIYVAQIGPHLRHPIDVPRCFKDLQAALYYAAEASQRQAGVVADRLMELGAERVFLLYGGIEAWKAAGLPTDGD